MKKLIAILNVDRKFGIGQKNGLLFHLPKDMAFFRTTTKGHTVALGENTLLSFPGGKPLKGRHHIVLSQDATHEYEGVDNVHTFPDFLKAIAKALEEDDVYIIGGASIYRQMLPYCHEVLLTYVDEDGGAEVFFPRIDQNPSFHLKKEDGPYEDNGHTIYFRDYENQNPMPLK